MSRLDISSSSSEPRTRDRNVRSITQDNWFITVATYVGKCLAVLLNGFAMGVEWLFCLLNSFMEWCWEYVQRKKIPQQVRSWYVYLKLHHTSVFVRQQLQSWYAYLWLHHISVLVTHLLPRTHLNNFFHFLGYLLGTFFRNADRAFNSAKNFIDARIRLVLTFVASTHMVQLLVRISGKTKSILSIFRKYLGPPITKVVSNVGTVILYTLTIPLWIFFYCHKYYRKLTVKGRTCQNYSVYIYPDRSREHQREKLLEISNDNLWPTNCRVFVNNISQGTWRINSMATYKIPVVLTNNESTLVVRFFPCLNTEYLKRLDGIRRNKIYWYCFHILRLFDIFQGAEWRAL